MLCLVYAFLAQSDTIGAFEKINHTFFKSEFISDVIFFFDIEGYEYTQKDNNAPKTLHDYYARHYMKSVAKKKLAYQKGGVKAAKKHINNVRHYNQTLKKKGFTTMEILALTIAAEENPKKFSEMKIR